MSRRLIDTVRSHVWLVSSGLTLVSVAALPAAGQNQHWIEQFGTGTWDEAWAAAPDGSGGVYLVGETYGDLGGPNLGESDAWLARYDGAKAQLWIQQLGTSDSESAWVAAMDGAGGVYVGGSDSQGGWLARYEGAGNQLWIRQNDPNVLGWYPNAAAPDGSGGVFLGSRDGGGAVGILSRFDGSGTVLWTINCQPPTSAAQDGSGGVFVGQWIWNPNGKPVHQLARYDRSGTQLWTTGWAPNGPGPLSCTASDGAGGVYVGGYSAGSAPNAALARYDSVGNQLWIRLFGTSDDDRALAVAADGSGGAFLAGETDGSLGGPHSGLSDAWLARFDGAGTQLWIQQFGTSQNEAAFAAAPDGSGGVYLGGSTRGSLGGPHAGATDAWLARYDSTCPTVASYCVASTTSIPGCQAAIAGSGPPSYADPTNFTISSGSVPGGNVGICFFGNLGKATIPFGTLGGQICATPPVFRCASKSGGGTPGACDGQFLYTLQDLINASPANVFAGAILNAQIWARDPANPDGFLLSDGLEFTVCP